MAHRKLTPKKKAHFICKIIQIKNATSFQNSRNMFPRIQIRDSQKFKLMCNLNYNSFVVWVDIGLRGIFFSQELQCWGCLLAHRPPGAWELCLWECYRPTHFFLTVVFARKSYSLKLLPLTDYGTKMYILSAHGHSNSPGQKITKSKNRKLRPIYSAHYIFSYFRNTIAKADQLTPNQTIISPFNLFFLCNSYLTTRQESKSRLIFILYFHINLSIQFPQSVWNLASL